MTKNKQKAESTYGASTSAVFTEDAQPRETTHSVPFEDTSLPEDDHPDVMEIELAMNGHGVVHVELNSFRNGGGNGQVSFRKGTTTFDYEREVVEVETEMMDLYFPFEELEDWYLPKKVWV